VLAKYEGGFRMHFRFNDDVQGTVDLESGLEGPIFEPLKDRRYFERFFIDGGTVVWPNGADIAPETLYEAVVAILAHRVAAEIPESALLLTGSERDPAKSTAFRFALAWHRLRK
jgi:hypothetical protein